MCTSGIGRCQIKQSDGETSKAKDRRPQKSGMSLSTALSSSSSCQEKLLVFLKLWAGAFGFPQFQNPQWNCGGLN